MFLRVRDLITLARAFTAVSRTVLNALWTEPLQVAYYRRNLTTIILYGPRFLRVDNGSSKYPLLKRIQIRSSLYKQ
jgi:hypothetical protein